MSELYELVERPELESPVLVLALDGWIDAGLGAANARAAILGAIETITVATFDSDTLLDHRARRGAGSHRTRRPRSRSPRGGSVGASASLRVRHALSRGERGPAGGSRRRRGRAHRERRAPRRSHLGARTHRRARCRER